MCSVGDDNLDGPDAQKYLPAIDLNELNLENKCNKCRENTPCIVLRHKDAYCKDCFLNATTHKFKAFLGKHRFISPGDNVLINYKEGQECAALMHLCREGLNLTTPKKLKFKPIIVYVESNFTLSVEERLQILEAIKNQCVLYDFEVHFVSLLKYILNPNNLENDLIENCSLLEVSAEDNSKIKEILKDKPLLTHKMEYLKIVERNLLYKVAEILNCRNIITPELGSNVAAELLTSISLGRGIHLPLDIGICDDRHPNIKIMRPMRHFDTKEVAMYNHFHLVNPVCLPEKAQSSTGSIQGLMKSFVNNLQVNFPATITTIVRIGDKLALNESLKTNPKCKLCMGPIEHESDELCSAESTMFSHLVSSQQIDKSSPPDVSYANILKTFDKSTLGDFCYACSKVNGVHF